MYGWLTGCLLAWQCLGRRFSYDSALKKLILCLTNLDLIVLYQVLSSRRNRQIRIAASWSPLPRHDPPESQSSFLTRLHNAPFSIGYFRLSLSHSKVRAEIEMTRDFLFDVKGPPVQETQDVKVACATAMLWVAWPLVSSYLGSLTDVSIRNSWRVLLQTWGNDMQDGSRMFSALLPCFLDPGGESYLA